MVSIFAVGFTTGIETWAWKLVNQQGVIQISAIEKQQALMGKIGHKPINNYILPIKQPQIKKNQIRNKLLNMYAYNIYMNQYTPYIG